MILIGQYDSPFVRRVAVALRLYRLGYEHRPWSTFGDAERLAAINPLRRVPVLLLDDGEALIESGAILDHLDEQASPDTRLIHASGAERRRMLRLCALATGLCDKMVSLIYERILHETVSERWVARCEAQIRDVLAVLEAERAREPAPFWNGVAPGHADMPWAARCASSPRRIRRSMATAARGPAWRPMRRVARHWMPSRASCRSSIRRSAEPRLFRPGEADVVVAQPGQHDLDAAGTDHPVQPVVAVFPPLGQEKGTP